MSLKMEDPLLLDSIKKLVKDKHSSLFTAMLVKKGHIVCCSG
jgi:hypothetical protein